jgi:hypothetical protein
VPISATDHFAVYVEDTNVPLYTNKLLQLFAIDYNGPGPLLQRPLSMVIQCLCSLPQGGGAPNLKLLENMAGY